MPDETTAAAGPAGTWASLDAGWQEAFRQAWAALRAGSIAVGAGAARPDVFSGDPDGTGRRSALRRR